MITHAGQHAGRSIGQSCGDLTVLIFLAVSVALAFGHLPGFKVDRNGSALVGAMVMKGAERIGPQAAWDAIDHRTVGLMVAPASVVVSGFYA
jgi:hypothetical protein